MTAPQNGEGFVDEKEVYGGKQVWVFMGERGQFPMGIWSSLDLAHRYIHDEGLTGSLTAYDLDVPVFEWAIKTKRFKPMKDQHLSLKFRQTFNNQFQEHYNFRDGYCQALGNPKYFEEQD